MALTIRELHRASSPKLLNEEWFVVENTGETTITTLGCSVATGKGSGRLKPIGTLEPGFNLAPGEKKRIVSGSPGKKSQGKAPDEAPDVANYYLFLPTPLIQGAGTVIAISLKQLELARAVFDPKSTLGVGGSNGANGAS